MTTTRRFVVHETDEQARALESLEMYNLCLGQTVKDIHGTKLNVIWNCKRLSVVSNVFQWEPRYAFGYVEKIPADSTIRIPDEMWVECNLGSSVSIEENGSLQHSSEGQPNVLTVAGNKYHSVHPVIGLWDVESHGFLPLYIDEAPLNAGSQAHYEPLGECLVWYDKLRKELQIIHHIEAAYGVADTSMPNSSSAQFIWQTEYFPDVQRWKGQGITSHPESVGHIHSSEHLKASLRAHHSRGGGSRTVG